MRVSLLTPLQKEKAADPSGWYCSDQSGTFDLRTLRLEQEVRHPSRFYWKQMTNPDGQNVILCYKYAATTHMLACGMKAVSLWFDDNIDKIYNICINKAYHSNRGGK